MVEGTARAKPKGGNEPGVLVVQEEVDVAPTEGTRGRWEEKGQMCWQGLDDEGDGRCLDLILSQ